MEFTKPVKNYKQRGGGGGDIKCFRKYEKYICGVL